MAWLSFVEAGKASGISRKVIMRWSNTGQISSRTEFRGKREVTVVDEDDVRRCVMRQPQSMAVLMDDEDNQGQAETSVGQDAVPDRDEMPLGDQRAQAVGEFLIALQSEKTQLQAQVSDLSRELGRLQGVLEERDKTMGQVLAARDELLSEKDKRIAEKDLRLSEQAQQLGELREWYRQSAAVKERPKWRWPWQR
jgi:hypothetical protein